MRPKKNILLVDHDSEALGRMKFMLETRGYRVFAEDVRAMAETMLEDQRFPGYYDLTIWRFDRTDGAELMRAIENCKGATRVLMFSRDVKEFPRWMRADVFLPALKDVGEFHIIFLDKIRMLCSRKRGPKKQVAAVLKQEAVSA